MYECHLANTMQKQAISEPCEQYRHSSTVSHSTLDPTDNQHSTGGSNTLIYGPNGKELSSSTNDLPDSRVWTEKAEEDLCRYVLGGRTFTDIAQELGIPESRCFNRHSKLRRWIAVSDSYKNYMKAAVKRIAQDKGLPPKTVETIIKTLGQEGINRYARWSQFVQHNPKTYTLRPKRSR